MGPIQEMWRIINVILHKKFYDRHDFLTILLVFKLQWRLWGQDMTAKWSGNILLRQGVGVGEGSVSGLCGIWDGLSEGWLDHCDGSKTFAPGVASSLVPEDCLLGGTCILGGEGLVFTSYWVSALFHCHYSVSKDGLVHMQKSSAITSVIFYFPLYFSAIELDLL